MSGSLASFDNYSSGASESIQKLVYNEHRGRKSQKRVIFINECYFRILRKRKKERIDIKRKGNRKRKKN